MSLPPSSLRFRLNAQGQPTDGEAPAWLISAPGFMRVVGLAIRLRQPLVRPVVAASDTHDATYRIAARPDRTGVDVTGERLSLFPAAGPRAPLTVLRHPLLTDGADPHRLAWTCDARLRLTHLDGLPDLAQAPISLGTVFRLEADDDGILPILAALANGSPFIGQRACRFDSEAPYLLSGQPLFDDHGKLSGFDGSAEPLEALVPLPPDTVPAVPSNAAPTLGRQVDLALRAPLTRIIAGAATMAGEHEGPIRTEYAAYARDIADAAQHLLGLVDDLADLQVVESDRFEVAVEPVDLGDAVRRVTTLLSSRARARGATVTLRNGQSPVVASGEDRRVLQILLNLVGNALDYGPEHGTVTITLEGNEESARVCVTDEGPGIAPELRGRLFTRFDRLGRSDHRGSGLGLYISRRLAQAMGGTLELADQEPGATFVLTLPRHP